RDGDRGPHPRGRSHRRRGLPPFPPRGASGAGLPGPQGAQGARDGAGDRGETRPRGPGGPRRRRDHHRGVDPEGGRGRSRRPRGDRVLDGRRRPGGPRRGRGPRLPAVSADLPAVGAAEPPVTTRKEVEARCPHCGTRLLVDVATGQVLRKEVPGGSGERPKAEEFDAAVRRRGERAKQLDDAFGGAVQEESEKKKRLEDAFERAKKKAAEEPDEGQPPPGFNW